MRDGGHAKNHSMKHQFQRHYTLMEARDMLPAIRVWLERLFAIQQSLAIFEPELVAMLKAGCDLGGNKVNSCVRMRMEFTDVIEKFEEAEIQVKDLQQGLIDFPAIVDDKEVFLCWHKGEDDIEFWHDIDSGFSGRQKISPDYF